jgi:O-antigen ligase
MPRVATYTETLRGNIGQATSYAPLSWGMLFLLLFTMVALGRVQEVFPALAPLRIGVIFGGLAGLAWFLAPGSLRDKIPVDIRQVRYIIILFALSLITIPVGVWPSHSLEYVLQAYWKDVLLFLLILYWCRSLQDLQRMVWICCIGATMLVVSGFGSYGGGADRFMSGDQTNDPNDLAMLVVIVLPLMLYLFSVTRPIFKPVVIAMALVCLYGLILTQSRGGFVALLAVGLLMVFRKTLRPSLRIGVLAASLLVFAAGAGTNFWERMQTMTLEDETGSGRTDIWKRGVRILVTHPWGVGIAGYEAADGEAGGRYKPAHNIFLQVGVELGLLGGVIYILLLKRTVLELRRVQAIPRTESAAKKSGAMAWATNPAPRSTHEIGPLAAALELSLWGFMAGGFFLSQGYSGAMYILLGLAVSCVRMRGVEGSVQPIQKQWKDRAYLMKRKNEIIGS